MSTVRRVAARAVYEVGTIAGQRPTLPLAASRLLRHGVVATRDTDLVIEGFPRSGNTIAVATMRSAGPDLRLAHHLHAPAHVLFAVRRGIPALVLIRHPDAAIVEFLLSKPFLSADQALRGYRRFYRPLAEQIDGFVVARFEQVHEGPVDVVRRLNARFGTAFPEPDPEVSVAQRVELADRYWEDRTGPGLPFVGRTPAPAQGARRELLMSAYLDGRLARSRAITIRLYERFAGAAG